jgi:hypothetical protein
MTVSIEEIQRIAGLELNALRASGALGDEFEKVGIPRLGTPIYDINGSILFYRMPLSRGKIVSGYVDIAADEALGEPLLATSMGLEWNEKVLLKAGTAAAQGGQRGLKYDTVRFVAYSFPKIALQFLVQGKEVLMLELYTWAKVPPARPKERKPLEPSNFERWSLLDELPKKIRESRVTSFKERMGMWDVPALKGIDLHIVEKEKFQIKGIVIKLIDSREIHYSSRNSDHHPCYELRGQQTWVWCVPASVEMLLNFYRYHYDQPRLAQEMDQGTCEAPKGLSRSDAYKVVNTIKKLSSNTLDATDIVNPDWNTFRTEIQANRPLISWIIGHSRTVAGYTASSILLPGTLSFRGLLVYDPWPPTDCAHPEKGGAITRWENFATQTYWDAFTAVLKHV